MLHLCTAPSHHTTPKGKHHEDETNTKENLYCRVMASFSKRARSTPLQWKETYWNVLVLPALEWVHAEKKTCKKQFVSMTVSSSIWLLKPNNKMLLLATCIRKVPIQENGNWDGLCCTRTCSSITRMIRPCDHQVCVSWRDVTARGSCCRPHWRSSKASQISRWDFTWMMLLCLPCLLCSLQMCSCQSFLSAPFYYNIYNVTYDLMI